jgi:hypothetical protein
MKTKIFLLLFLLPFMSKISSAQLKVDPNGSVGMGIDPNNPNYKVLIKGNLALTTYPQIPPPLTRYTELRFKVGNGSPGCEFGTPTRNIAVWSSEVGYNNLFAAHYFSASDYRLKTNDSILNNGLAKIRQLLPYSFNMRDTLGGDASTIRQYGFIAQDVNAILPDITDTVKGIMLLDYQQIIPFAVGAIKQLDSTVTDLKNNPRGVLGTGTANYLAKWHNTDSATSSSVYDNGIIVGIGTTSGNGLFNVSTNGGSVYAAELTANGGSSAALHLQGIGGCNGINVSTENGTAGYFSSNSTYYAGYFNGNVSVLGTFSNPSDQLLKTNIVDIQDATQILTQLRPRTFNFKTTDFPSMNLPTGTRYGLIAQELETVLPDLVSTSVHPAKLDSAGNIVTPAFTYKSANYEALIPILVKGFKEQDSIIKALQSTINTCCNITSRTTNNELPSTDVELSSKSAILYQNMPNPFGDGTTIRYFVPENSIGASIIFYDEFGNEIKNLELPNKGITAELNLATMNLATGIYSYSLIVNSKVIDTKRMVKAK